jgi:hypothetical protein
LLAQATSDSFFFNSSCGVHVTLKSVAGVVKNENTLVYKVCEPNKCKVKPSSHEQVAYTALQKVWGNVFMTEIKVLGQKFGAVDILLTLANKRSVAIMIDGKHHFTGGRKERDASVQSEADSRFNQAALSAGLCVVRLHYKDCWEYEYLLRTFIHALSKVQTPTMLVSPSFNVN